MPRWSATIPHIITGTASCQRRGCDRTWPRDSVLEVACPDCRAPVGVRCRRPSGHAGPFVNLHAARDLAADRAGAYGHCPLGCCGHRNQPEQAKLPF